MSVRVISNSYFRANRTGDLRSRRPYRDARLHDDHRHRRHGHMGRDELQRYESAGGARHRKLSAKGRRLHRDLSRAGQLRALRPLSHRAGRRQRRQLVLRPRLQQQHQLATGERRADRIHQSGANGLHGRHDRLKCLPMDQGRRGRPGKSHRLDRVRGRAHADVLLGHARRRHAHRQVRVRPPGIVVQGQRSRHRRSGHGHRAAGPAAGSAGIYARR